MPITQKNPKIHTSDDKRLRMLTATMKRYQYSADALIEVLHQAQELFGYLAEDLLLYIAHSLKIPPSRVYGVATFYHFFSLKQKGVHTCVVCLGTACYVKGAANLLATLEQKYQIKAGETTSNNQLSLVTARCLGACGIAPTVVVDDDIEGHQTSESVVYRVEECLRHGS
jgi:bidirectional [NiFe] hydrogenase diaphorase subunit